MARYSKREVIRDFDMILPEIRGTRASIFRKPKATKMSIANAAKARALRLAEGKSDDAIVVIKSKSFTEETGNRVFLYLQITDIVNVPNAAENLSDYEIRLDHTNKTLQKVDENGVGKPRVKMDEAMEKKTTFNFTIMQDSIKDMNSFSNSPLFITLYKKFDSESNFSIERGEDSLEEEDAEELWVPIAQGSIDLLEFFTTQRFKEKIESFLYPVLGSELIDPACKVVWDIYSLFPLLKNTEFCNTVFITFESLYNANYSIMFDNENIRADISFQSKTANAAGEYDKIKFCTFANFDKSIIAYQYSYVVWENLKREDFRNGLGSHTGTKIHTHKLFKNLLCTEGVDLGLNEIALEEDEGLVCNSMHRFVLNAEMVKILEEAVVCNRYHLLVEIYKGPNSENVLLHGIIEPHVFGYPKVNACRFAVALNPVPFGRSKQINLNLSASDERSRPSFAIVNICFLLPITEKCQSNASKGPTITQKQLNRCTSKKADPIPNIPNICTVAEKLYKQLEKFLGNIARQLDKTNHAKKCEMINISCHRKNLNELLIKIIACDFNMCHKTETNREFRNLITKVYDALEERTFKVVSEINQDEMPYLPLQEAGQIILKLLTTVKTLREAGVDELANILHEKITNQFSNYDLFHFSEFLYHIETQNFEEAMEYFERPVKERSTKYEYLTDLALVYIQYVEALQDEMEPNEALQMLLPRLRAYLEKFPKYIDVWILLHCLYKKCNYLPGMEFTRWKYENLVGNLKNLTPSKPKSRWNIYITYSLTPKTMRGNLFEKTFKVLAQSGLYKFAKIVFDEFKHEFVASEQNLISTTLKILQNEIDFDFSRKSLASDRRKAANPEGMAAQLDQLNGHVNFLQGNFTNAMSHYARLLNRTPLTNFTDFQLAMLRYAYHALEAGEYAHAISAFEKCTSSTITLIAQMGMGICNFKRGHLQEAERNFAECTKFNIHFADVWTYLALINLKMGYNTKALQCWVYANQATDAIITQSVWDELNSIDLNDVDIFYDPK